MSSLEQVSQQSVALTRDRSRAIFGQTMGLVAVTAGVAGFGAYLGRDLSRGVAIVAIIGAIVCIVAMNAAIKRSEQLAIGLLFGMGALIGVSSGPILAYYASVNPSALWQSAGSTALFIGGFGAFGYATRRDLEKALFSDGLSTRSEVTDVSGRGVGMSAVLAEVDQPRGNAVKLLIGILTLGGVLAYSIRRVRRRDPEATLRR